MSFFDSLAARIKEVGSRLCVGIDPPLPPQTEGKWAESKQDPLAFLTSFTACAIGGAKKAAAVKFQSAFYEAYGPRGLEVLASGIAAAKKLGIPTLLDAKRGDISSTMKAYGVSAFEVMQADSLTVTPYLGVDVLEPLSPWLQGGKGTYLVWVTSNPSSHDLQSVPLADPSGGRTFATYLLRKFQKTAETGGYLNALGLVVGTTKIDELEEETIEAMRDFPLLLPGLGPQGGALTAKVKKALTAHPASIVPMSRAITGFGDKSLKSQISHVASDADYWDFVVGQVEAARKMLEDL